VLIRRAEEKGLNMTAEQRTYIVSVGEEVERRITRTRRRADKIDCIDAALRLVRRRLPDCIGHPTLTSFLAACEAVKRDFGWRPPPALLESEAEQTQLRFQFDTESV
jgi:hypothetical protein